MKSLLKGRKTMTFVDKAQLVRHTLGRAVRFGAAVLASYLLLTSVLSATDYGVERLSMIAFPSLLFSSFAVAGLFSSHNDRSIATGVLVGLPLSFFIGQLQYALLIENAELIAGAQLILIIAGVVAICMAIGDLAWAIIARRARQRA